MKVELHIVTSSWIMKTRENKQERMIQRSAITAMCIRNGQPDTSNTKRTRKNYNNTRHASISKTLIHISMYINLFKIHKYAITEQRYFIRIPCINIWLIKCYNFLFMSNCLYAVGTLTIKFAFYIHVYMKPVCFQSTCSSFSFNIFWSSPKILCFTYHSGRLGKIIGN